MIPALGRQREDLDKTKLVFIVSSKPARDSWKDPVSQQKQRSKTALRPWEVCHDSRQMNLEGGQLVSREQDPGATAVGMT